MALRFLRTVFGLAALALLVAALCDVIVHGRLVWFSPQALEVIVAVVIAYVLHSFALMRAQNELGDRQAQQLLANTSRLQKSLTAAAAMNAQLNQNPLQGPGRRPRRRDLPPVRRFHFNLWKRLIFPAVRAQSPERYRQALCP